MRRKKAKSRRASGVLVVEFAWFAAAVDLCVQQDRFRFHIRLSVSVDSLHAKFDHPLSPSKSTYGLRESREKIPPQSNYCPNCGVKVV